MSRIPVFIERKGSRRSWTKGGSPCIFIARESIQSSNDLDLEQGEGSCRSHYSNDQTLDHLNHLEVGSGNRNIGLIPLSSLDEVSLQHSSFSEKESTSSGLGSSTCEQNRISNVHSYQHNTTSSHKIIKDTSGGKVNPTNIKDTSLSLAVVSCSKGVINSCCNCTTCVSSTTQHSTNSGSWRVEQLQTSSCKGFQSLIPKPLRFVAGTVTMTPAPVRRSKLRKNDQFRNTDMHRKELDVSKADIDDAKYKKNLSSMKSDKRIGRTGEEIDPTISVASRNVLENKTDNKVHHADKDLKVFVNAEDHVDVVNESARTSVNQSRHFCEDSEPEYAQHEMQKAEAELAKNVSLLAGVSLDTDDHCEDTIKLFAETCKQHPIESVAKAESNILVYGTPVSASSDLPVTLSKTHTTLASNTTSAVQPVSNAFTVSAGDRNSAFSSSKPQHQPESLSKDESVIISKSSKLPVKARPAFGSSSSSVLTSISKSLITSTPRASCHSPQRSHHFGTGTRIINNGSYKSGKCLSKNNNQKTNQTLCRHVKISTIQKDRSGQRVTNANDSIVGTKIVSPKRNLPEAPAELRSIKLGEMCGFTQEDFQNSNTCYIHLG